MKIFLKFDPVLCTRLFLVVWQVLLLEVAVEIADDVIENGVD